MSPAVPTQKLLNLSQETAGIHVSSTQYQTQLKSLDLLFHWAYQCPNAPNMINISVYTYTRHNINTQPISRKKGGLRLHNIEYQQLFWSPAQHTLEITQSLIAPCISYNWYHSPYEHPLHHTQLNSLNLSPFFLQHTFKTTQPLSIHYTITL